MQRRGSLSARLDQGRRLEFLRWIEAHQKGVPAGEVEVAYSLAAHCFKAVIDLDKRSRKEAQWVLELNLQDCRGLDLKACIKEDKRDVPER